MQFSLQKNALRGDDIPRRAKVTDKSELYSGRQFKHTACITILRHAKNPACDERAASRVAIGNRSQLKSVEDVVSVQLQPELRVMLEAIKFKLLGKAHVGVEVARSAEAIAANARRVVAATGQGSVELRV